MDKSPNLGWGGKGRERQRQRRRYRDLCGMERDREKQNLDKRGETLQLAVIEERRREGALRRENRERLVHRNGSFYSGRREKETNFLLFCKGREGGVRARGARETQRGGLLLASTSP